MSSATSTVAARAVSTPARAQSASAHRATHRRERSGFGLFAKLVAVGFWGTFASLLVGAVASAGLLLLFLVPLLGFGYVVFCLIAATGDRNVD